VSLPLAPWSIIPARSVIGCLDPRRAAVLGIPRVGHGGPRSVVVGWSGRWSICRPAPPDPLSEKLLSVQMGYMTTIEITLGWGSALSHRQSVRDAMLPCSCQWYWDIPSASSAAPGPNSRTTAGEHIPYCGAEQRLYTGRSLLSGAGCTPGMCICRAWTEGYTGVHRAGTPNYVLQSLEQFYRLDQICPKYTKYNSVRSELSCPKSPCFMYSIHRSGRLCSDWPARRWSTTGHSRWCTVGYRGE